MYRRHRSWSLGLLVVALSFGAPISVLAAAKSKKLNSDLVAAAEAGETQKVKALLGTGAEVNGKGGEFGWTALMSAPVRASWRQPGPSWKPGPSPT